MTPYPPSRGSGDGPGDAEACGSVDGVVVVEGEHPELVVLVIDQPHFGAADLIVDP